MCWWQMSVPQADVAKAARTDPSSLVAAQLHLPLHTVGKPAAHHLPFL